MASATRSAIRASAAASTFSLSEPIPSLGGMVPARCESTSLMVAKSSSRLTAASSAVSPASGAGSAALPPGPMYEVTFAISSSICSGLRK